MGSPELLHHAIIILTVYILITATSTLATESLIVFSSEEVI